jgi:hypothetical protein
MLALYFAWYDFARHSYPNGQEWLLDHHRQLWRDIQTVGDASDVPQKLVEHVSPRSGRKRVAHGGSRGFARPSLTPVPHRR